MVAPQPIVPGQADLTSTGAVFGFDDLCGAHVAMLTGTLLDGVDPGPGGCRYVWSDTIPDPTLNFAIACRSPQQIDWALNAARRRGREPAFLARDTREIEQLRASLAPEAVFAASWMVADASATRVEAAATLSLAKHVEPEESFFDVFGALSDDARVCEHVLRHYVPSLRRARRQADVQAVHLVLHDGAGPATCASLYVRHGLAGLYNVSTRADRQRRGLGAVITACALAEARERAASHVFLQCPADGFVERLYARAGFDMVCSPSLVCLKAP